MKTRDQIIDSMCLTFDHSYGATPSPEGSPEARFNPTQADKDGLRRSMAQVYDHEIAPLLIVPPDDDCPACKGEAGHESGGPQGWVSDPCTCHPMRQENKRLHADLEAEKFGRAQDKVSVECGYAVCVGGILNAYRAGGIAFTDAVSQLRMKGAREVDAEALHDFVHRVKNLATKLTRQT